MLYGQEGKLTVRLNMNSIIFTFINNEIIRSIDKLFKIYIVLSSLNSFIFSLFYSALEWNYGLLELNKWIACKKPSFLLCQEPGLWSHFVIVNS